MEGEKGLWETPKGDGAWTRQPRLEVLETEEWAVCAAKRARVQATCHAVPFYSEDARAYEPPPTLASTALHTAQRVVCSMLGIEVPSPTSGTTVPLPPPPMAQGSATCEDSDESDSEEEASPSTDARASSL